MDIVARANRDHGVGRAAESAGAAESYLPSRSPLENASRFPQLPQRRRLLVIGL